MAEFQQSYNQQPNAAVPVGLFLLGLIIGGGLFFGFQKFQDRTQETESSAAPEIQVAPENREQQAKQKHAADPGYWLAESDKALLQIQEQNNILTLLDYPKGMSERDYSSRPQAVAPKEYYVPTMTVLFLKSNGQPMWSSLESQKKWLELQLQYSSEALINDKDQDGIVAFEENVIYKTSDTKADTDGDGFTDSAEIKAGFDPLQPEKKLNEWIENPPTLSEEEKQELELLGPYLRGEEDQATAKAKLQQSQREEQENTNTTIGNFLPASLTEPK